MDGSRRRAREHWAFSHELLQLRQWLAVVAQKLESYLGDSGPWDAQAREAEVQVSWLSLRGGGPRRVGGQSASTGS